MDSNLLDGIKQIEFDLLKKFDEVCKQRDLRYCAIYGTLLGAVRHSGFIPWDDDIDVAMPREDYDKLGKGADEFFNPPYFLQTPENDSECFYNGYYKLRNSNTTGLEPINLGHNCNQGIWIDIFPIDNCYENPLRRSIQVKKITFCQRLLWAKVYPELTPDKLQINTITWNCLKSISKIIKHSALCRLMDNVLKSCKESNYLAIYTHHFTSKNLLIYNRELFQKSCYMMFEGIKIPVPIGYKECLKLRTGINYMIYPEEKKRKPHHCGIYNLDIDYKTFIRNNKNGLKDKLLTIEWEREKDENV